MHSLDSEAGQAAWEGKNILDMKAAVEQDLESCIYIGASGLAMASASDILQQLMVSDELMQENYSLHVMVLAIR